MKKKSKTEPLHWFNDDDDDEYKQKSSQSKYYDFIECQMRD